MKGTALFPQCGFSSRAVAILDHLGVTYRDGRRARRTRTSARASRTIRDWPTIPQLYVKGEFVGGSDIMMEMFESGELQQLVGRCLTGRFDITKRGGGAGPETAAAALCLVCGTKWTQ